MVARNFCGQELDGGEPAELEVFGFENHTHAPAAERFQNAVMRDGEASHGYCSVASQMSASLVERLK